MAKAREEQITYDFWNAIVIGNAKSPEPVTIKTIRELMLLPGMTPTREEVIFQKHLDLLNELGTKEKRS